MLDQLAAGKVVNRVSVHPEARRWSRVSLNRMLKITGAPPLGDTPDPAELQDALVD